MFISRSHLFEVGVVTYGCNSSTQEERHKLDSNFVCIASSLAQNYDNKNNNKKILLVTHGVTALRRQKQADLSLRPAWFT